MYLKTHHFAPPLPTSPARPRTGVRPLPSCERTDRCENITFPHPSECEVIICHQIWKSASTLVFYNGNIFQSTHLGRFQLLYLLAADSLRMEPLLFSSTATGSVMGTHPSDGGPSCATRIIFTSRYLQ